MAVLSMAIALPLRLSARHVARLHRVMTAGVGVFPCALGVYVIVQIGYLARLVA